METASTLSDVLTYSAQFDWETYGIFLFDGWLSTLLTLCIVAFGGFWVFIGAMSLKNARDGFPGIILVFGLAIWGGLGAIQYASYDELTTDESRIAYEKEEAKWERELATPYMEALPVVAHENVDYVEYNYDLQVEDEKKASETKIAGKELMPLKVFLKDGQVLQLWAKVLPLEKDMKRARLEYKLLEKDLIFHERSEVFQEKGYFDTVLYTDEKI